MQKDTVIGGYVGGIIYPNPSAGIYHEIKQAGWTHIILSMYHIDVAGNISFNKSPILKDGNYVASPDWPGLIAGLKENSKINSISASIGGWGTTDFAHIKAIYNKNGECFNGTELQKNFQAFRKHFPAIDIIDLDCEETYDLSSFVDFCKMLVDMGFNISFCPYTFPSFWVDALYELENYKPGCVKSWNVQCYISGTPNVLRMWVNAITNTIRGFNTEGFIISGDRCRVPGEPDATDCPAEVAARLREFAGPYLGGGFIWTIDHIIKYQNNTSSDCGKNVKMEDYVDAIAGAFINKKIKATNGLSWK